MACRGAGFTLVEVLVGLVLISVILLSVSPLLIYASRVNSTGADLGSCSALAMERMELLRTERFAALVVGGSLEGDEAGYVDAAHPDYVVRWQISDAAAPAGAKQIAVRAEARRSAVGRNKRTTLITLRTR